MINNNSEFNLPNTFLIPNEFFDKWLCYLNYPETKVIILFSMEFLEEFYIQTGLSKGTIPAVIKNLIKHKFIKKTQKGYGKNQIFTFELLRKESNIKVLNIQESISDLMSYVDTN